MSDRIICLNDMDIAAIAAVRSWWLQIDWSAGDIPYDDFMELPAVVELLPDEDERYECAHKLNSLGFISSWPESTVEAR